MAFHGLPWPSLPFSDPAPTLSDLLRPSLTFSDLLRPSRRYHGTLTEGGVAFTGPLVIGEDGEIPAEPADANGGAGGGGEGGAARLGSLLVAMGRALRRYASSWRPLCSLR